MFPQGGIMKGMWFKKGDLVTIRLPKNGMPSTWVQEYVIVNVTSEPMSETFAGKYEARAIGSDVSEYFVVWNATWLGGPARITDEANIEVIIQDTDEYNFDNSPYNK